MSVFSAWKTLILQLRRRAITLFNENRFRVTNFAQAAGVRYRFPFSLGAWDFHFGKGRRKEHPCPRGTKLVIDADGNGKSTKIKGAVTLDDIKKRDWNDCHIIVKDRNFRFYIKA